MPEILWGLGHLAFGFVLTCGLADFFFFFATRCCGGAFTTTSAARSKRAHASGWSSTSFIVADFAINQGFLAVDYRATIGTYCGIMEIIKSRAAVVHECLRNPSSLDPQALYELCFLEFRMICELIALGCLVAHGDIKETRTKKLQNDTYNAHEIVRALDSLHPNFYPRHNLETIRDGKPIFVMRRANEEYLTKEDLKKLYALCGDILHIGSLKKLLNPDKRPKTQADVVKWLDKITNLLNHHKMLLVTTVPLAGKQEPTPLEIWIDMHSEKNQRPIGYIVAR